MNRCISVYPELMTEDFINKLKKYLFTAQKHHIQEVFTSIHLPEFTIEDQISFLELVSSTAKQFHMELTADIGGSFIKNILENSALLDKVKNTKIDFLRLDYGYQLSQLKELYHSLHLKGFVLNASMVNEKQLDKHIQYLKEVDPLIQIKACHNFYVREESGLDYDFAFNQSMMFKKRNIPVYYCVPDYTSSRGPLHLGLCTIEEHRFKPLDLILLDLMYHYHAEAILLADPWISEENLSLMDDVIQGKPIEIKVELIEDIPLKEKAIVLQDHIFRYDSNSFFLRSRSSREMAEFASSIQPHNCIERTTGTITIDNINYKRYSGEMQVVLKDSLSDKRVNVVGVIPDRDDLIKLRFFREGIIYRFIQTFMVKKDISSTTK